MRRPSADFSPMAWNRARSSGWTHTAEAVTLPNRRDQIRGQQRAGRERIISKTTPTASPAATPTFGLRVCCAAIAATPGRLLRPRAPDKELLASIHDAGLPPAHATVRLVMLPQAISTAPGPIVVEGAFRPLKVSMSMTTFLVEHPQGRFLIDPAMCADVHAQVVPLLPRALRRVVAPKKAVVGLGEALSGAGLSVTDIDFVLPTHLHWDHIAGLLELPAPVPVLATADEHTAAMHSAVTEILLRRRPFAPYLLDGPPVLTFTSSFDLFEDGSVILVDLAGHTPGSVGIILALDDGTRLLLAGDAVWHSRQVVLIREKAPFPGNLVDHDRDAAFAAIHRLHALPAHVRIIAAHDSAAITAHCAR